MNAPRRSRARPSSGRGAAGSSPCSPSCRSHVATAGSAWVVTREAFDALVRIFDPADPSYHDVERRGWTFLAEAAVRSGPRRGGLLRLSPTSSRPRSSRRRQRCTSTSPTCVRRSPTTAKPRASASRRSARTSSADRGPAAGSSSVYGSWLRRQRRVAEVAVAPALGERHAERGRRDGVGQNRRACSAPPLSANARSCLPSRPTSCCRHRRCRSRGLAAEGLLEPGRSVNGCFSPTERSARTSTASFRSSASRRVPATTRDATRINE